ncbi:MAG: CBS domain-containing protein [Bacteroidetes bacterium]|nr:CBS domain-containing protein [Bacteroidota bacterium]
MGEKKFKKAKGESGRQQFVSNLLQDMQALEYMLHNSIFEKGVTRIGAEQEMCIIRKKSFKAAPIALDIIELLKDMPWLDTELAKFNLEINLDPRIFTGSALKDMEAETKEKLHIIKEALFSFQSDILLTGILPTLHKNDLESHNLTPRERYKLLVESLSAQLLGQAFELRIQGIDELLLRSHTPLLEAANTSFQVHLQVDPENFVSYYNIAQALTAPVLGISANSPIVFGRRLWHESRIALFQQALDVRTTHEHMRERSPRVNFGSDWVHHSILDIYREDIARFRSLIYPETYENAMEAVLEGNIPKLSALQIHNSTVYRWNRPCYGISDTGKPHLRIENRVLPAGPTVVDEIANAALWLGAVIGCAKEWGDIRKKMSWEDVRDNFEKAARFGIDSKFTWFKDKKITVTDLVNEELIPLAKEGLTAQGIHSGDIDFYMNIISQRAKLNLNGARWQLRAFTKLKKETSMDEAITVMTSAIYENQKLGKPVHTWELPELKDLLEYRPENLRVEEFMQTDLFTVSKDDLIELVAKLMDWRKVRYMPVEDQKGNICGLITSRLLLRFYSQKGISFIEGKKLQVVEDIMIKSPIVIEPGKSIIEALQIMREKKIGCLPVVTGGELIGIITEMDFLRISARLIERLEP